MKINYSRYIYCKYFFLYGNSAYIYNVCNGERTISKFLNLCPILLIYVNKVCLIHLLASTNLITLCHKDILFMKVDGRVLVYSENLEYLKIEDFLKCRFEELIHKYFC